MFENGPLPYYIAVMNRARAAATSVGDAAAT